MNASKYTKLEYIASSVERGVYASPLESLNDPYETIGIRYVQDYRVCCMTKSPFKMLLWSHYSTHYGCRIDFTFSPAVEKLVKEVIYSKEIMDRFNIEVAKIPEFLCHKGSEWDYEKELRAVWSRNGNQDAWNTVDGKIYLKAKVTKVTFGLLADKRKKDYLTALKYLKNANNKRNEEEKIAVCKCKLREDRYALVEDKQYDYIRELENLLSMNH